MKTLLLLTLLAVTSSVWASGCNWDASGITETKVAEFPMMGVLNCEKGKECIFNLGNTELKGTKLSAVSKSEFIKKLDVSMIRMDEYGDCFNDGVTMVLRATIQEEVYSLTISYYTPYSN
jgi:hypothetical protein